MTAVLESVRSSSVPRELAMRLALGRAVETLEVLRSTGRMPDDGDTVLRFVAQELRKPVVARGESRSSLLATLGNVDVLTVATEALEPDSIEDLYDRLARLSDRLDALANGEQIGTDQLGVAISEVTVLRQVVAAARATKTDEVLSSIW